MNREEIIDTLLECAQILHDEMGDETLVDVASPFICDVLYQMRKDGWGKASKAQSCLHLLGMGSGLREFSSIRPSEYPFAMLKERQNARILWVLMAITLIEDGLIEELLGEETDHEQAL